MRDFFDIPDSGQREVPQEVTTTNTENVGDFFVLPKSTPYNEGIVPAIAVDGTVKTERYIRIKQSVFDQMKQKIVDLSVQLHDTKQQNEKFADFLMRVTFTLRDIPNCQQELKAVLDFLSKFLIFKKGKFQFEVMSLMMALGSLPKDEFGKIIAAINFHAWNGFNTEGVLNACREYGIDFPDIAPVVELFKTYVPDELLNKHKNENNA